MATADSVETILRAKAGDRDAWEALCTRYYPQWVSYLHGKLGRDLRVHHSTQDIVDSALAEALRHIKDLRNEASFFSWVAAIIRRKLADKRRELNRSRKFDESAREAWEESPAGDAFATMEEYSRVLDAILALFPLYPEHMAALYFKHFEGLKIRELEDVFGRGERAVYGVLDTARNLLRSRLGGE